jgi:DNA-binding transcriptional ArsR family regulator
MTFRTVDTETKRKALRLLRDQSVTIRAIAKTIGVTVRTLGRWASLAGLPPRNEKRLDTTEVLAMDAQFGPNGAAYVLGCSPGSVHYHRQRARRLKARKALRGGR